MASTQQNKLSEIADAIRTKDGSSEPISALDFASRITNIPAGKKPHEVRFIDLYDIEVSNISYNNGENSPFTSPPIYEYLTFAEYTHTQEELNNLQYRESERGATYIPGHIDVGFIYKTTDEKTHIWFNARTSYSMAIGLSLSKVIASDPNPIMNINWGDGTTNDSVTLTTTNSNVRSHTYATEGRYHITIWSTDNAAYSMGAGTASTQIVTTGNLAVDTVYISEHITLKNYAFNGFKALKVVSLPPRDKTQTLPLNMFADCSNLHHVSLPRGYTELPGSCFINAITLDSVVIPTTIQVLGTSAFQLTPKLLRLVLPKGIHYFSDNFFNTGSALELISDVIDTIGANAFNSYYLAKNINLAMEVSCSGTATFSNAYSLALKDLTINFTSTVTSTALTWCHLFNGTIAIRGIPDLALPAIINWNSCDRLIIGANFISITGNITSSGIFEYVFEGEVPPTMSNASFLNQLNKLAKIYVPDSAVNTYKTATNWTGIANYIYPMSQLPPL